MAMFQCRHFTGRHCIEWPRKNATPVEISNDNSFQLGRMLEFQYHLLEHVFHFLETTDLHSASLVNAMWEKAAKRELQRRTFPTWISCFCASDLYVVESSRLLRYNDESICIVAYRADLIEMDDSLCIHEDGLQNMTFAEYIDKEIVLNKTNYCVISCSDVSPSNLARDVSVVYQGVFIPSIPNIRITTLKYTKKTAKLTFLKHNEQLKCLLVFTQRRSMDLLQRFMASILMRQSFKDIAMGGGLIRSMSMFQNTSDDETNARDLFFIGFVQPNGVEADFDAYSTVIQNENDVNYKSFETAVLKLKQTSVLRRQGIIFRFCCCAKKRKSKETVIIENHFPRYVVLGVEVDGEIGWNSNQELSGDSSRTSPPPLKKSKAPDYGLHQYSTVLVLITWGRK